MFYNDKIESQLVLLTTGDLHEIEGFSAGMDQEEILEFYAISMDELKAEQFDYEWFVKAFKRGRAIAKKNAVDKLFRAMDDRQGGQVAISYLKRFGNEWPADSDGEVGDGKFSFKVVLND